MQALTTALIFIAYPAGLVSAFLFLWWIPLFISHFTLWDVFNPVSKALTAYDNSNYKVLFFLLRDYFSIIAGLFGWVALIALL